MRIYLSLMVSNATGERTFSKLKLIKSEKRTCMVQSRLTCLSLMSIENELLKNLDCEEIIDRFVRAKCRKNQCKANKLWYSGFPSSWWYSVIIWELRMCTVNIWFFPQEVKWTWECIMSQWRFIQNQTYIYVSSISGHLLLTKDRCQKY